MNENSVSNLIQNKFLYLPKLIFFFLLYFLITKETVLSFLILISIAFITIVFLKSIKDKSQIGIPLVIFSLFLILPLSFNIKILPTGYQYIVISIIGSILFLRLDNSSEKNFNFISGFINLLLSALAPTTYLSGPSATVKEFQSNQNPFQILPTFKSITKNSLFLAISGFFKISVGYSLLSQSSLIDSINHLFQFKFYLIFPLVLYGFFYFWKYYLLFSGASDLCKALLSTININVIDNFKNPELSIFFHDIWVRWHLNISDRVRKYLYTPITLYALRNSYGFNKLNKFIFIEGLPVITLFLILGVWHGGRPKDFLVGFLNTVFVLISRALSKNKLLKSFLNSNNIFLELFRLVNLIIFGAILSIYDMPFGIVNDGYKNYMMHFIVALLLLAIINIYYRLKNNIYSFEKEKNLSGSKKKYFAVFEIFCSLILQLFFINDVSVGSEFLYFAN